MTDMRHPPNLDPENWTPPDFCTEDWTPVDAGHLVVHLKRLKIQLEFILEQAEALRARLECGHTNNPPAG